MKNTTQSLKRIWTSPIGKSGKFYSAYMGKHRVNPVESEKRKQDILHWTTETWDFMCFRPINKAIVKYMYMHIHIQAYPSSIMFLLTVLFGKGEVVWYHIFISEVVF